MTTWHDKNGQHESIADAEIAERIKKIREANKKCDRAKTPIEQATAWQERIKAHNEVEPGLGDNLSGDHGGRGA